MNYRTIQRHSISQQVMQEILSSIQRGDIKPGEKLPTERELAGMFHVGRSTVREAVSALALVGYLTVVQGRGTFLKKNISVRDGARFDLNDIQTAANIVDLVEVREILECNTVRLAARRAAPEDLERIQKALLKMKAAAGDMQAFTEKDIEFHTVLAQSTGNAMIAEMTKGILHRVYRAYDSFQSKRLFQIDIALATAGQIVVSITEGREADAARSMRDHLHLVTKGVKQAIPDVA